MEPIINSFLDTDLYKLSMQVAVIEHFSAAQVEYKFVDRNDTVYPDGFAELVKEQVKYLEDLRFTDSDAEFMRRKCKYIPDWYYTYLKGFRFSSDWVDVSQDSEGHLNMTFKGYWHQTILLEVMMLAIVSELYHTLNGDLNKIDYDEYYKMSYEKAEKMLRAGLVVSDFGTRRRFCLKTQEIAVNAFIDAQNDLKEKFECNGAFPGTSNVYLAKKYDLTPIGTMAHEFISVIAGCYGVQQSNYKAMKYWQLSYRGSLGLFLPDCYTFDTFLTNFNEHYARAFAGLRVDSGDNVEMLNKIIEAYKKFNVDPKTKQVVFSNALDTDSAIALHKEVNGRVLDAYGIGTHLTADGSKWGIKPNNIVAKVVKCRLTPELEWNKTCKISDDKGKVTGDSDVVDVFKFLLHLK